MEQNDNIKTNVSNENIRKRLITPNKLLLNTRDNPVIDSEVCTSINKN
jgi:hypothetical protein